MEKKNLFVTTKYSLLEPKYGMYAQTVWKVWGDYTAVSTSNQLRNDVKLSHRSSGVYECHFQDVGIHLQ